jgi:hypothetical protein
LRCACQPPNTPLPCLHTQDHSQAETPAPAGDWLCSAGPITVHFAWPALDRQRVINPASWREIVLAPPQKKSGAGTVHAIQLGVAARVQAVQEQSKADLAAERAHYEGLLNRARASQLEAEQKAATAAKEGSAKKLRDAESRAEALAEAVEELRAALDRQRASADLRQASRPVGRRTRQTAPL